MKLRIIAFFVVAAFFLTLFYGRRQTALETQNSASSNQNKMRPTPEVKIPSSPPNEAASENVVPGPQKAVAGAVPAKNYKPVEKPNAKAIQKFLPKSLTQEEIRARYFNQLKKRKKDRLDNDR